MSRGVGPDDFLRSLQSQCFCNFMSCSIAELTCGEEEGLAKLSGILRVLTKEVKVRNSTFRRSLDNLQNAKIMFIGKKNTTVGMYRIK